MDDAYVYKRGTTSADHPDLALSLVRLVGPTTSSSSHSKFEAHYDVLLSSGELTQQKINVLTLFIMSRVSHLSKDRGIFVWKDTTPLTKVTFLNGQIGLTRSEANRSVQGFSSLCTIVADLQLQTNLFLSDSLLGCVHD